MEPTKADRLQSIIEHRHSERGPFDQAWPVSERELMYIIDAARWAPTLLNMQNFRLVVVDDRHVLARLGEIRCPYIAGSDDPAGTPSHASRLLGETFAGAPMLIVVAFDASVGATSSGAEVQGMISLGCVVENMWLAAHACHLDAQVVSALAVPDAELEVKRQLGIPAPWRVALALRLGHALARSPELRVRREPAAFVSRNRFA